MPKPILMTEEQIVERIQWLRAKVAEQDALLKHYETLPETPLMQHTVKSEERIRVRFAEELAELIKGAQD